VRLKRSKPLSVQNPGSGFSYAAKYFDSDKISLIRSGAQNQDINMYYKSKDNAANHILYTSSISKWQETIIQKMKVVYHNGTPVTVYANWFDVQSDITARAGDFFYYRSVSNELKYSYRLVAWYDFTASELNKHIKPVNNCAGNIILEGNNRKVWYKGTDEKIRFWNPSTGQTGSINTNYAVHSFVMHSCGCLAFYRDNVFGLLWQLYKIGNNWHEIPVASYTTVNDQLGAMVIDEDNTRIYFIGHPVNIAGKPVDRAIYYYNYGFTSSNPTGLVKLGIRSALPPRNNSQLCNQYYNAYSNLTLSPDKNMLYYLATDNRIWYYFNDKENSSAVLTQGNPPVPISLENWNKTPLHYYSNASGPMAFDPVNKELFYGNTEFPHLNHTTWVNADNPVICSITANTDDHYNSFRRGIIDTISHDENDNLMLTVYPNPSNNSFTFEINSFKEKESVLSVQITDIAGKQVFRENKYIADTVNNKIIWSTGNSNSGIYFYKIQFNDRVYSGKLLKL
jgi:hypothetical protein